MPEGTIFFPNEPILRVTAPLPEAQLAETRLINLLHFQSLIAAKAARFVLLAPDKPLVDFGLRRAHGAEAGLMAAREPFIAGFAGTATMLAGKMFGIPLYGTMAHSFIQAFDDETTAFQAFAESRPENLVLLIDTYETEAAARKVVALAPRLQKRGISIRGVRLDSGDLIALSRSVRRILDEGGLERVTIFASGDRRGRARNDDAVRAPIDGFGIGTSLTTSSDVPALGCAYKLQEYAGLPRRKRSQGKTWPGRKQVWRTYDGSGRMSGDVISLEDDRPPGEPLLKPMMKQGRRLTLPPARRAPGACRPGAPALAGALAAARPRGDISGGNFAVPGSARERGRRAPGGAQDIDDMTQTIGSTNRDVLLVVDIQNDFCPGGRLPVPNGHEVVPLVNRLAQRFEHVVLTQLAPRRPSVLCVLARKQQPLETIRLPYGIRCSGPTTASRARSAPTSTVLPSRAPSWCCARAITATSIPIRPSSRTTVRRRASPATCASGG